MNLDDRIRQSIERHTASPGHDAIPQGLLGRARRRIALTVAGGTLAVAAVAGGGALLAGSLSDMRPKPNATPTIESPRPEPTPVPSAERAFVSEFLEARKAGSGAEEFLSETAAEHYAASGFVLPPLYGDESREVRFGEASIDHLRAMDDGTHAVLLRVQVIYLGDSPVCPVTERLVVGRGTDADGMERDLVVLSAERVERGWEAAPLSRLSAQELACGFMDARLAATGAESPSGAETFLSDRAAEQYSSGEGGLELYPDEAHAGFWWIVLAEEVPDGVRVVITLNNTGQPDAVYEELVISTTSSGEFRVEIASGRRITCEEAQGSPEYCP